MYGLSCRNSIGQTQHSQVYMYIYIHTRTYTGHGGMMFMHTLDVLCNARAPWQTKWPSPVLSSLSIDLIFQQLPVLLPIVWTETCTQTCDSTLLISIANGWKDTQRGSVFRYLVSEMQTHLEPRSELQRGHSAACSLL